MINEYPVTIFVLIMLGMVSFLVLGWLVTNNKLKPPYQEPASRVYWLLSTGVIVLLIGMIAVVTVMGIVEKSGWIPRTREVPVYAKAQTWVQGEIRTCETFASKQTDELTVLVCSEDDRMLDEHHTLRVRFWGPILTDRNKEWKCVREPASLTCRLQ
jgi:hypothetical protein